MEKTYPLSHKIKESENYRNYKRHTLKDRCKVRTVD